MKIYQDTLTDIIENGNQMFNKRTGITCHSKFGVGIMYDTGDKSPMPTIKEGYFTGAKVELAWILKGLTNTDYLHEHKVYFWDKWRIVGNKPRSVDDVVYLYERRHGKNSVVKLLGNIDGMDFKVLVDKLGMLNGPVLSHYYDDRDYQDEEIEIGELGSVYGAMLRRFPNPDGTTTDQLQTLIDGLRTNPSSRRHVVSLWCPFYLPDESISPQENVLRGKMALAPCHFMWTFHVEENHNPVPGTPQYKLNLHFNMRSNDYPAGNPVNVVFYDLLLALVAQTVGMEKGKLWFTGTNVHVYSDQLLDAKVLLNREPLPLPTLVLDKNATVFNFEPHMAVIKNYKHRGKVSFKVAK